MTLATNLHSIQTRDLNLWYGDFQALKHINLNITDLPHIEANTGAGADS